MSRLLEDLHPKIQPLAREFKIRAEKKGLRVIYTATHRSFSEQDGLYAQGRTKPGKIVTNAKGGDSWHNYALAFDIAIVKSDDSIDWGDKLDTNHNGLNDWQELGKIGKELGLAWGGDFKSIKDTPHFEYHPGITLADARARKQAGKPVM